MLAAQEYIHTEQNSGAVLLLAAIIGLAWANSPWKDSYFAILGTRISLDLGVLALSKDLQHWINDGLMALFFFVVGLEIKRELVHGELASPRRAALPVAAALGGMIVPAAIYLALNAGSAGSSGWGVPMATDIAFALGALALVGSRMPPSLRLFLLTLAVVDDIGAILVIAFFYTEALSLEALAVAAFLVAGVYALNRLGLREVTIYGLLGVLFWLALVKSGVHATLAGVVLGLMTPAEPLFHPKAFGETADKLVGTVRGAIARGDRDRMEALLGELEELTVGTEPPVERLERLAHPWASYVVLPVFALANAGVTISPSLVAAAASSPVTYGVFLGLVLGKVGGVLLATALAVRLRVAELPAGLTGSHVLGVGFLAGIGFTVSLFIAGLAFDDAALGDQAKVGIFVASLLSGLLGYVILRSIGPTLPVSVAATVADGRPGTDGRRGARKKAKG